jgi:beta-lactam-binding protein with PASTA domain/predicted Ser/Thr protein kinase
MTDGDAVLVGGRYELGELLGRGGMAEVRKGTDLRLGRAVAVKRLRTDLASDATFQARFRREAQSSASLNHPSIVAVYDTGEEMATDGSGVAQPYIVMEYVAGRTLRDVIREGRKILPERALEITSGVLSALDYSHRSGIIHRDIKPGNVMLTTTGDVKVMDFGIARAVADATNSMTQTAAVVGTAQYLSPEQARGETVDSRSDVYSTGCLLYELLTGRPPFVGDSPVAVAYQHVREPASPPSDHDTELPPEIDAIVMKALAKRVEDRYQSAAAMRNDIERFLAGQTVQAPAVPAYAGNGGTAEVPAAAAAAAMGGDTATNAPVDPEGEEDQRGNRAGWIIAAVLLLLLIGLAAWLLPRFFESPEDRVRVPDLVGETEQDARAELADLDLEVSVSYREDDEAETDTVVEQDPSGVFVDVGSTVELVVSSGRPVVEIPFLVGQDRDAAEQELRRLGLEPVLTERDTDAPAGEVVALRPGAGEEVPEGSTVTVFYSDGPEQVPGVVGDQRRVAAQKVRDAGFKVEVRFLNEQTDQPRGTVVEQTPEGGTPAEQGSVVYLFVTQYEEPSPSPSPTDTPSPSRSPSPSPTSASPTGSAPTGSSPTGSTTPRSPTSSATP